MCIGCPWGSRADLGLHGGGIGGGDPELDCRTGRAERSSGGKKRDHRAEPHSSQATCSRESSIPRVCQSGLAGVNALSEGRRLDSTAEDLDLSAGHVVPNSHLRDKRAGLAAARRETEPDEVSAQAPPVSTREIIVARPDLPDSSGRQSIGREYQTAHAAAREAARAAPDVIERDVILMGGRLCGTAAVDPQLELIRSARWRSFRSRPPSRGGGMTPEKHSVERGCDHDDGDEADHDPGGSLLHFLLRQGSQISLAVESQEVAQRIPGLTRSRPRCQQARR